MEFPPGPLYVFRVLLQALPASVATYGILHVLGIDTPKWLLCVVLPMAHPALNFMKGHWRAYKCRLDASTRGAVLIPRVQEGGLATRAAMVSSMQSYPGAPSSMLCRGKYGALTLSRRGLPAMA